EDGHAAQCVSQRPGTVGGDADVITLDHVAGRLAIDDVNAIPTVGRDDIPRRRGGPADRVVRCRVNLDTLGLVAQDGGPRQIRADLIAGDDVAIGTRDDPDAVRAVAGDQVTFVADGRPAVRVDPDPVGRRSLSEDDTGARVA